jgi:hypothetical protein
VTFLEIPRFEGKVVVTPSEALPTKLNILIKRRDVIVIPMDAVEVRSSSRLRGLPPLVKWTVRPTRVRTTYLVSPSAVPFPTLVEGSPRDASSEHMDGRDPIQGGPRHHYF